MAWFPGLAGRQSGLVPALLRQSVHAAFPFQIDHVRQLDSVLNDGMVVIVGKEVLHPVGIFETAGMVKAQGEGTVPGAHIKCLQIRIIGKDIFNQAAAVSLSMELGGLSLYF